MQYTHSFTVSFFRRCRLSMEWNKWPVILSRVPSRHITSLRLRYTVLVIGSWWGNSAILDVSTISLMLILTMTNVEFDIVQKYCDCREEWETSANEPSKMVATFMKTMRTYLRCRRAIQSHDGWHLKIESAKLIPVWKGFGKTMYLWLQCEFMETFYDPDKVLPIHWEIMRANAFCVKQSGRPVAFDEENKNYNLMIKRAPVTPSLDLAIFFWLLLEIANSKIPHAHKLHAQFMYLPHFSPGDIVWV